MSTPMHQYWAKRKPDMAANHVQLLDTLLVTFEAHSRDHDKDDVQTPTDLQLSASSIDSATATQKQTDCLDLLSALKPMCLQQIAGVVGVLHAGDATVSLLTSKICEFVGVLASGRACPHSNFVFGFGKPSEVSGHFSAVFWRIRTFI